jgi:16S rRNA processing protein RimM
MLKDHCTGIGSISRPHGIKGEMILRLENVSAEEINLNEPLFLELQGTMVPFFIEEFEGSGSSAIIKLEFIDSAREAKKYAGTRVYTMSTGKKSKPVAASSLSSLIGYHLTDQSTSQTGIIKDFLDNKSNPLFLVDFDGREVYIPAHGDLIVSIDHRKKSMIANLPEGMLDINE